MRFYENVAVALLICTNACAQVSDEDPIEPDESVADVQNALGSGSAAGGAGVVEIEARDTAKCTGFLLNAYMIMTAAHCVYSGQPEGTKDFKIRKTNNGTSWTCISGPSSGQACSGWSQASYAAWNANPPENSDPTSDYAIIYRASGFNDNNSIGIAPDKGWVGDWFDVWGRGTTNQMRHDEGAIDSVRYRIFIADYDPSLAVLCEGDSGGPAFPYHAGYGEYVKYAAGMAVEIRPPEGEDRAGSCTAAGEQMIYHRFSDYTIEAINWVAEFRLGLNVCPYCTCTDVGDVYPGIGLEGYYVCNSL